MKKGDKILCIKDFDDRFKAGNYYVINYISEYKVVMEYQLTEIEKKIQELDKIIIDNCCEFWSRNYGRHPGQ